jgi:predicted P-loop ATPase
MDLDDRVRSAKERAKATVEGATVSRLWEHQILRDKHGFPKKLIANVILVMTNDEAWRDAIAWDEFAERVIILRECPAGALGPWTDLADVQTAVWLQRSRWHLEVGHDMVANAVRTVAERLRVHPVREWLRSGRWDGKARLDSWLSRYLGVADTPYARAIGRRFLIAAVARVFQPGCQVDTMLILEGDQGLRKSSALRVLAGDEWFLETQVDLRDPSACHALRRRWIVEFSELAALKGGDVERVKAFVSTRVDSYRPPYGRHVLDHPRQCVLVGSTNARQYLRDETGARRFWPVRVSNVDIDALAVDRDQLWAEAVAAYDSGERWYLDTEELRLAAEGEQEERRAVDPWEDTVAEWLSSPARQASGVSTATVLGDCLGVEVAKRTRADEMRVGAIFAKLGWERRRVQNASSRAYLYFPLRKVSARPRSEGPKTEAISNADPSCPTCPTRSNTTHTHKENTDTEISDLPDGVGGVGQVGQEPGDAVVQGDELFGDWLAEKGVGP